MDNMKKIAKKAIGLLDYTNLNDDCSEAAIADLCMNAQTDFGNTAAVCIWKEFIPQAKLLLEGTGVKIATVVNFPAGGTDTIAVLNEVKTAIENGADEIDLVFPYRAYLDNQPDICKDQITKVRKACPSPIVLKVIIETGELKSEEIIYEASRLAIDCGADFIKTSTGKVPENATPRSAEIMLNAIKDSNKPIGFKPAGGIKTVNDVADYLELSERILGKNWPSPQVLRFGASGVLGNLLDTLNGKISTDDGTGY